MLELPQKTLNNIKRMLLARQKEVRKNLQTVEKEDPLKLPSVAETTELGTESFLAQAHLRTIALVAGLKTFAQDVKEALFRIKNGTYGHCLKCPKHIETARLLAMPTATLCLSCSKKMSK